MAEFPPEKPQLEEIASLSSLINVDSLPGFERTEEDLFSPRFVRVGQVIYYTFSEKNTFPNLAHNIAKTQRHDNGRPVVDDCGYISSLGYSFVSADNSVSPVSIVIDGNPDEQRKITNELLLADYESKNEDSADIITS